MKKTELLAPAGNPNAIRAAVQAGADAVYIGGNKFNARHNADNFSLSEMKKWIAYCHLYGVKVYVAVNTLIKESETDELISYAKELNKTGADGVIIQDMGAAFLFSQIVPELPLHASTQMTVTSAEAVKFLEEFGIKRVVLARELSFKKIHEISKATEAELEIFVHGALCMCYSGQCLMSSIIGGRSGNRGRCAQPCRLKYSLLEHEKKVCDGYLLSPKDLNLSDDIESIKSLGNISLKIEGRLKRAEYVAAVVYVYRKYLNTGGKISADDKKILLDAFNRGGFTKGFFGSETGAKMMCHNNPSNVSDNQFPEFIKQMVSKNADFKKIPVYMHAQIVQGEALKLTLWDDMFNTVNVTGDMKAERAESKPLTSDRISEQLKKLGNTPFVLKNAEISSDNNIILPISEINSVRRQAVEKLTAEREGFKIGRELSFTKKQPAVKKTVLKISVEVETEEQLKAAEKYGIERIYAPEGLNGKGVITKASDISKSGKAIKAECISVSNLADIYMNKSKKLYGGVRLNIYNSYTIEALGLKSVVLSPELNIRELADITSKTDAETEVIAYGRLTLMIMANCPIKACGKCAGKKNSYSLKDRKNEKFPILCSPDCNARLINSKPLYMADKWEELQKTGADYARLVFTTETGKECEQVIRAYCAARAGKKADAMPENSFTRGHFFRGVE